MESKLKSAIYGLAIGDALGVPYEFKQRGTFNCTDMIGYGTHNQPEGTWSDDTSMTLATCSSIKEIGNVDCNDIRKKFEDWLFNSAYTPFGDVFDCGYTCSEAIYNKNGLDDIMSNGNGSLMRILPLAFMDEITDEQISEVSAITHAHAISKEACIIYVRIAKGLINGDDIKSIINSYVKKESVLKRLLYIDKLSINDISSSGYVVDSLEAAIWCFVNTNNYKDCVLNAVNLGGDTDTIAAIAGGLAGIVYGYGAIPNEWKQKLQRTDIINKCL